MEKIIKLLQSNSITNKELALKTIERRVTDLNWIGFTCLIKKNLKVVNKDLIPKLYAYMEKHKLGEQVTDVSSPELYALSSRSEYVSHFNLDEALDVYITFITVKNSVIKKMFDLK